MALVVDRLQENARFVYAMDGKHQLPAVLFNCSQNGLWPGGRLAKYTAKWYTHTVSALIAICRRFVSIH